MVMRPDVWGEALDSVLAQASESPPVLVVPTPSGEPFTAAVAEELAGSGWWVFACGRYEGIDARVMTHYRDRCEVREISIGDVVLAGCEAAVLVMVEGRPTARCWASAMRTTSRPGPRWGTVGRARLHPAAGVARAVGTAGADVRGSWRGVPMAGTGVGRSQPGHAT
jgi:hypothetical protein